MVDEDQSFTVNICPAMKGEDFLKDGAIEQYAFHPKAPRPECSPGLDISVPFGFRGGERTETMDWPAPSKEACFSLRPERQGFQCGNWKNRMQTNLLT